jgi:hypothetical protein
MWHLNADENLSSIRRKEKWTICIAATENNKQGEGGPTNEGYRCFNGISAAGSVKKINGGSGLFKSSKRPDGGDVSDENE